MRNAFLALNPYGLYFNQLFFTSLLHTEAFLGGGESWLERNSFIAFTEIPVSQWKVNVLASVLAKHRAMKHSHV